ncbi:hypothetical protein [Mucilaginibacter defluvii]|uniref:hypothetical protein n=1 Tax=Mucilaginibacter defluvii TaxID=1196019 RepID=UPI0031E5B2E2
MITTRIIIGLVAGCFLTIINIYPAYAEILSHWNTLKVGRLPVDSDDRMVMLADSPGKKKTDA